MKAVLSQGNHAMHKVSHSIQCNSHLYWLRPILIMTTRITSMKYHNASYLANRHLLTAAYKPIFISLHPSNVVSSRLDQSKTQSAKLQN